jgi:dihydrofolate synthase/folylpolyglutamate synthase
MPDPQAYRPIRSVEEAAGYLEGLINIERRPELARGRLGLGPIRRLLACLDHPERGLSVVHVSGSKGKGSTALLVEALLGAAGERVGVFVSPHLERWTERFRIAGREVPGQRLAQAVERIRPHVDRLRVEAPSDAPTFFDATTAAALVLFRDAKLDRVVLEVGLGGRLDSTNAVTPAITCITSIELEHTDRLGETLGEIAAEKAGILERGIPLVTGLLPPEAEVVIRARAEELAAPWTRLGDSLRVEVLEAGLEGSRLCLRDGAFELEAQLPVLGAHQARNAALALACVRRLPLGLDERRLAEALRRGFAAAKLPGRAELVARNPWIVVDGAHTPASARALADVLAMIPCDAKHLVLSVSAGKDLSACLAALLPGANQVTVTRAEPARSLDPKDIAHAIGAVASEIPVRVVPNPHLALRAARAALGPRDLLVATGSMYLAGIAQQVLVPRPSDPIVVSRRRGSLEAPTTSPPSRPRRA